MPCLLGLLITGLMKTLLRIPGLSLSPLAPVLAALPSDRRAPIEADALDFSPCQASSGLTFATCNVTSLKKSSCFVNNLADVVGFQESRHTALSAPVLASSLAPVTLHDLHFW